MDSVSVVRWQSENPVSEQELRAILAAEKLEAMRWSNGPGETYATHDHSYDKVIYVVAGAIAFELPATGDKVLLHTGDRLELPSGTTHSATVGPEGVTCLEAHRRR